MKNLGKPSVLLAVIAIFFAPADSHSADAATTPTQTAASDKARPFLSINGKIISKSDFDQSVSEAARRRLYHGAVNQEALARFQREALNETISRELVVAEAKTRGVGENKAKVDAAIASLDARYAAHPRWAAERADRMPKIREFYANASIFDEMESLVRSIPEPSDKDVLEFYKNNERLFIEPKKESLGLILFSADPARPATRELAVERAKAAIARLANGESFAKLASELSDDPLSSQNGGDLGYVHHGMLGTHVHSAVDALEPGATTKEPVWLLEGAGIFLLKERVPPKTVDFETVRPRALSLLKRQSSDLAWTAFLQGLKDAATIVVDESELVPLDPAWSADAPKRANESGQGPANHGK